MEAKESLVFDVDIEEVPPDCRELVLKLKEVAEHNLYKWTDDFNVTPPTSYFNNEPDERIAFGNIFTVPDFDESAELSRDEATGDLIRLNGTQLASVRRNGEFDIDSRRFTGQRHRWRLSRLLQKGTMNTTASLQKDAVRGLQVLFVTARNRWCGQGFSIRQSMKGFGKGFIILLDLFIGLPHTNCGDLNIILEKELQHYLVCELGVKGAARGQLDEYWNFLEHIVGMTPEERYNHSVLGMHELAIVQPPFQFMTPGKVAVDLRLHSRRLAALCQPILSDLREHALDGWFFEFRDRLIAELKKTGQNLTDIAETVNKTCEKEYYNRVLASVQTCEQLNELEPSLGETLVKQARFALICREADKVWQERLDREMTGIENEFQRRSPILSKMGPCVRSHMAEALANFQRENRYAKCEYALQRCVEEGLDQHAYFLSRLLQFWRERVPLLEKQVRATRQTFPDDVYNFRRRIWFPQNWIVRQSMYGIMTEVETEVLDEPLDSTYNRDQLHFTVHKDYEYRSSTRYPFWRWRNFFLRHYVLMTNLMGFFLIKFPFTSRFGARALFASQPFYGAYTHCAWARYIYPDRTKKVLTFVSRLRALWTHVRSSRRKFESAPNTGLMDKNVTRHLNRFWNYVLKGACGTALLCILFPPVSLLLTMLSFIMGATAPLWTPVVSVCYHLGVLIFIYDADKPSARRNAFFPFFEAVIYHWLIRGICQFILAGCTSIIFCPIISLLILMWGGVRFSVRSVWDAFMFQAIVKRHARVPAKEDWVARRISGPGLASNHFYHARPEQLLAALLATLEREQLDLWYANKRLEISEPMEKFQTFFNQTLAAFSVETNSRKGVPKTLREQKDRLYQLLAEKRMKRASNLQLDVNMSVRSRMKLSLNDLETVTRSGTKLVESFYHSKLLPLLKEERSASETSWWTNMNIQVRDFEGLFNRLLGGEFGEQVFTPLEETDTYYTLRIEHLDLNRYVEMLTEAQPRDDLDVATGVLKEPMRLQSRLQTPSLDLTLFEPQVALGLPARLRSQPLNRNRRKLRRVMRWRAVKKKFSNAHSREPHPDSLTALSGPIVSVSFNVYHPCIIALLLHKRDRSDHSKSSPPLPLEDIFLREVLGKVESHSDPSVVQRSASLASVNPDLVQSATTGNSPHRITIPNMASEASLSMATTEDGDFDEEDEEDDEDVQSVNDANGYGRLRLGPSDSQSTLEGNSEEMA